MKKLICVIFLLFISNLLFSMQAQGNSDDMSNSLSFRQDVGGNYYKIDEPPIARDWRFTIGGGYARRLGEPIDYENSELNKLMEDMRSGFNIDMELQYFFKEHWGLGMNAYFDKHSASSTLSNVDINTYFAYIGPTFNVRCKLHPTFIMYMSAGFGPLFYKEKMNGKIGTMVYRTGEYDKIVLSAYASVSGDYYFNDVVGLGLKLSVGGGSVDGKEFGSKDRLSLSNFMLTTYLSFRSK